MDIQILKITHDSLSKSSNDSKKFIGVYVNDELNMQLTLLSISEGVSKSTLLRKMVVDKLTPQDLIAKVATRIYNLFLMKAEPWSGFTVNLFKTYIAKELKSKGLSESLEKQILDVFDKLVKDENK